MNILTNILSRVESNSSTGRTIIEIDILTSRKVLVGIELGSDLQGLSVEQVAALGPVGDSTEGPETK